MYVMIKANIAQFCEPGEIIVGGWIRAYWLENLSAHPDLCAINRQITCIKYLLGMQL